MLIHENGILKALQLSALTEADRERVEEAARLEGISIEEATERKKGFRFLY